MNDLAIPDLSATDPSHFGPDNTAMIIAAVVCGGVAIFFLSLYGGTIYRKTKRLFRRTRHWDRRAMDRGRAKLS